MFAQAFRSNRPAVLLALLLVVPAIALPGIWRMDVLHGPAMPFYRLVVSVTTGIPWLPGSLALMVTGLCAVQLALLANKAELMGQRTHLPALLFPLLMGVSSQGLVLEPALLGMPFVLAAMGRIWSIAGGTKVLAALFDAGFLLGLAALFHLPFAFLLVVAWASVSVIRPFQWREYVLPIVGVALPLYFAWVLHSLSDAGAWQPLLTVLSGLPVTARSLHVPAALHWAIRSVLIIMVLVSLLSYTSLYQRGVMREKNLQASFMAFFFASAVLIALNEVVEGSYPAVLLAAPLAVFASHAIRGTRRAWLSELAVLVLLVSALWVNWS